jgi:hypothetical protein
MKKLVIISALWGVSLLNVFSQSTAGNNLWGTGRFLGFDGTQPANNFLPFRTNNIIRMALNGNRNTSVNGQPALDRNGYLGLGRNLGTANNWNDVTGNPSITVIS